jgi:hypothetical protein
MKHRYPARPFRLSGHWGLDAALQVHHGHSDIGVERERHDGERHGVTQVQGTRREVKPLRHVLMWYCCCSERSMVLQCGGWVFPISRWDLLQVQGNDDVSLYAGKFGPSLIFGVRHGWRHCPLASFLCIWPANGSCTTSSCASSRGGKLH